MKRGIIFVIVLLLFAGSAIAAEYSLEDLYRIALERSEKIKFSEEDLFISEQNRSKAFAALMPKLSAFWGYTRYTENKASSSGTLLQPDSSTNWGLRLDQSFTLNGRELTAFQIARDNIEKSRHDLSAVKEEYILSVSIAYYDVLRAKKALDISKSNVERLTKYRNAAAVRLKVGEVTKTVLLRAEAELAGAQSDEIRSKNAFELAKAILGRVVGISEQFDIKETSENETGFKETDTIDFFKQTALAERYEIKSFELAKKISEDQVRYTKGSFWPTVSLEGVYSRKDENPVSANLNKESTYGGVKITFPFFEGGLRKAEVRESESKMRQASLLYEDKKKTIFIEVESAYLDVLTQKGIKERFESQVAFADDNYKAVTKQFEYGIANSLDVMDANNLLVTAERQLADARFNYQLSVLRLKRATGLLLKIAMDKTKVTGLNSN